MESLAGAPVRMRTEELNAQFALEKAKHELAKEEWLLKLTPEQQLARELREAEERAEQRKDAAEQRKEAEQRRMAEWVVALSPEETLSRGVQALGSYAAPAADTSSRRCDGETELGVARGRS